MKRIILPIFMVVVLVGTVYGCATVHREIGYFEACMADDECKNKVEDLKTFTANSVRSSPISGNEVLAFFASNLVSTLGGMIWGRKVQKKKGV